MHSLCGEIIRNTDSVSVNNDEGILDIDFSF